MEMIHIHAQSTFLPFLYLTWYTTEIALLEPEAQLYQHLRKSRSSISFTYLPFRDIFCKPSLLNIQIYFAVHNHVTAPLFLNYSEQVLKEGKEIRCNTLR